MNSLEYQSVVQQINDNNRLLLTPENFKQLYRIAITERKIDIESQSVKTVEESRKVEQLLEKLEKQYAEFANGFQNPFGLDYECESTANEPIEFTFSDYDYLYVINKCRKGWRIYFYTNFWSTPDLEVKSLDIGYEYHAKDGKFYPFVAMSDTYIAIDEVPFELKLQNNPA